MSTAPLTTENPHTSYTIGAITIDFDLLPTGAFSVTTRHAGTGGPIIDELSKSFTARQAALANGRTIYRIFATGLSVQDYLKPQLREPKMR